ncbi:HXXEE domain-containing protein [Streptococcus mutans]|uniref:HXXEE domain-containing protein n=1 Tax=Streptococcus mutans TaxID=1309 RepID=UPI0014556CB6|nr:HXXEE domain-containing protein [Streptococcus mutans]MDB8630968.1 HXXEE domain-containing protein [Streptococcus mutans]MEE0813912.1 HXXEE domain-containing protein [Streptococcus mutans]NLQ87341.1 HXXEE domain-containing protein [Streptococcus mutans]
MTTYVWLFPLLFIFHDLEEIIGFMPWIEKKSDLLKEKAPLLLKTHKDLTTEGFALAVFEEFCLILLISLAAFCSQSRFLYLIWLGGLIAFSLHLLFHIIQAFMLRQYIPAVGTALLCLPISSVIILNSCHFLHVNVIELFCFGLIGLLIVIFNLLLALRLGKQFSKWLNS